MRYCSNCGKSINPTDKFCPECGKKTGADSSTQREQVFEGNIHKCPNCGTVLASFLKNCPDCGYELRGSAGASSVHEFSIRYANATSNSQKVDLIRTFVIPNTKEDILEFVILASSNTDINTYSRTSDSDDNDNSQQDVIEAWMAKLEQAVQKAGLLLEDDPYLEKIDKLYSEKKKSLDSARKKSGWKNIFQNDTLVVAFCVLGIFLILFSCYFLPERKLKKQVKQIETYIAEENYDAALTVAYSMNDGWSDSWTETRANLISRILQLQKESKGEDVSDEGKAQFPVKTLTGKQVSDVISILSSAGFTNVTKETVKTDLLTGWVDNLVNTEGAVKEITVNGSTDFTKGAWIDADTPIIVRYWAK